MDAWSEAAAPRPAAPGAAKVLLLLVAGLVLVATVLTGVVVLVGQKSRNEAAQRVAASTDVRYTAVDGSFRAHAERAPRTTSIAITLPDGTPATEVDYLFETSPTSGIVVYVVPVGDAVTGDTVVGSTVAGSTVADAAISQLAERGLVVEHTAPTTFAGHAGVAFGGRWTQGDGEYLVDGYVIAPPGRVVVVMDNERVDAPSSGVEAFARFVETFEVEPAT